MRGEGVLLEDLADRLGARIFGKSGVSLRIYGVGAPGDCSHGDIAYAATPSSVKTLLESVCSAIIVDEKNTPAALAESAPAPAENGDSFGIAQGAVAENESARVFPKPLLVVPDAKAAFIACLEIFAQEQQNLKPGRAIVAASAVIMENVSIQNGAAVGERSRLWPGVFVGAGSCIGADCILYPNVVIRERCSIGDRVIIHAGAVIGADGFGYTQLPDGTHRKIPQIGSVIIEDDVEIGANSAIDRATCGATRIGRGTKIDNLVQVAHNVVVGENNILAAQAGIAGSTSTGASCIFAGQAGIADHCTIGDRVLIGPQAGVQKRRVPSDTMYMGTPAIDMRKFKRIQPYVHRLPELLGKKAPPAEE